MIFIVLGMHKSGTTLMARILHESGIDMGAFDACVAYDDGNHFEREETRQINEEILHSAGARSIDIIAPCRSLDDRPDIRDRMARLVQSLSSAYNLWGFKDPRTCLTYSLWSPLLSAHKVIIVYRQPGEIWNHYRSYVPTWKFIRSFAEGCKALRAWYIYNSQLVSYLRQAPQDCYVVSLRDFMSDPRAIDRLASFAGLRLVDSRNPELYRRKQGNGFAFRAALAILAAFCESPVNALLNALEQARHGQAEGY